ncbi:hypothetical protein D3C73_103360 [compost metagenome]
MRACLLYGLALIMATGYPLTALAASPDPSLESSSVASTPAAPKESYTFNPETNRWDSNKWKYDPSTSTYQRPPAPAPPIIATPETPVVAGASNQTSAAPSGSSSTTITEQPTTSTTTTQQSTLEVGNNLNSQSQTGNAGVVSNTTGGNATSGNALATTTVVNAVHSTIQGDTAGVAHFTADIYGNVVGDITLGPALDNALTGSGSSPTNTVVNADQTANLTNNISLGAASGNANVINNTTAGNATTGTANTVANVINLINSIIAANKSFIGTINIYGNLDGDILISPSFIPQLLASNAPTATNASDSTTVLNANDTQSIINNVTLNAASGSANVLNNTTAGNATTGTAATNLTILNYTGHQVVASNSLLIFVNVLGRWVGLIVDAPAGATAAVLGNGVTSNTATGGDQTVNANTTSSITNNIDLASLSGDATVRGNTQAGNATSGNATASANIANISTSSFSVSDWFGVLFINVFDTWLGSFGVDTANGTVTPVIGESISPVEDAPVVTTSVPQFGFVPRQASRASSAAPMAAPDPIESPIAEAVSAVTARPAAIIEGETTAPVIISEAPQPNSFSAVFMIASLIGATVAAGIGLYRRQDM